MRQRPQRQPMRYRGHDYRAPCMVHVTICTHHRQTLFGAVTRDGLHLNDAGRFVAASLDALHSDPDGIAVDTAIVMPDHLHAILMLGTTPAATASVSIPDLVHAFKLRVTKAWPRGVRHGGWPRYEGRLWQRTYYDTLIRNDTHLDQVRAYIRDNPRRWLERFDP